MTTRLELRTAIRRRLEDTSGTPLWDDATLNDFLAEAMRGYGTLVPREAVASLTVPAGVTSIAISSPTIEPERITRVLDNTDAVIPRRAEEHGGPASEARAEQAWRWWASTLLLERAPAVTGIWRIEYLSGRASPSDDVTAADIIAGDEDLVVLLATTTALRRRAVEDGKRGIATSAVMAAATTTGAEADRLIARRRRRPRGGWLR